MAKNVCPTKMKRAVEDAFHRAYIDVPGSVLSSIASMHRGVTDERKHKIDSQDFTFTSKGIDYIARVEVLHFDCQTKLYVAKMGSTSSVICKHISHKYA